MAHVNNSVFISYRRTNKYTALALFKELKARGYNVFFDYQSIKTGAFGKVILREIEARAHFLVVLTPSALERCNQPGDWVRREIEHAIIHKRNIIPLLFDDFDFDDAEPYLTGDLALLKQYNGLRVPVDYFDAAITRLANEFLNVPINTILHPTPDENMKDIETSIQRSSALPTPTPDELSAEGYFERGMKRDMEDIDGRIHDYTRAINLREDFAEAYNNRGITYYTKGDYEKAIDDFTQSITHDNPELFRPYINRGNTYLKLGQFDQAIADYDEAIRLNPDDDEAYNNRGIIFRKQGKYNRALEDYHKAVGINPLDASPYLNIGLVHESMGNIRAAIENFEKYVELGGRNTEQVLGWIEENKQLL